jgi:hypothetical protein
MGKGIIVQKKSSGLGFLEVQEVILASTVNEERMPWASFNQIKARICKIPRKPDFRGVSRESDCSTEGKESND